MESGCRGFCPLGKKGMSRQMVRKDRREKVKMGSKSATFPGWLFCVLLLVWPGIGLHAESSAAVVFTQSAPAVAVYDFVEVTAKVAAPAVKNPFTEASISGDFEPAGAREQVAVEGFCDSADGSLYRIRFMPSKSGKYTFHVTFKAGAAAQSYSGAFTALDQHRRGPLRVDPAYPWHFIWEGTGEHYFFNGTTAYWLMGWRDERTIEYSIDRLVCAQGEPDARDHRRAREHLFRRARDDRGQAGPAFLSPWPAQDANDFSHPGFDYSRFNVPYWQKFERMLRYARDRGMVISLVLDMNDGRVHPAAGSEDERRLHPLCGGPPGRILQHHLGPGGRSRLSIGMIKWTHETGTLIEQWDPYHHLATSHPVPHHSPGPRLQLVRVHLLPGLVAQSARPDA